MKILTVVGARPQFIKAAPVSKALSDVGIEEVIVHTGQHFDDNMSKVFFDELNIPKPAHNLDIHGVGHGAMTGRMLEGIEALLQSEGFDALMVYGDTNSTLAGALAAKKLRLKVIHIEAGLRSFNMAMPEEINRILTDRISDVLYCPTQTAMDNLEKEGYEHIDCKVELSGDVMEDAALHFAQLAKEKSNILSQLSLEEEPYVLCTLHREENTDDAARMKSLVDVLNRISEKYKVVLPLHPRTKNRLERHGLALAFDTIEPVGYLDMIQLISSSALVMTDSGGLQKEAYFFGKYCVTMRDQTEWVELVNHGFNTIAGADAALIESAVEENFDHTIIKGEPLYGGGKAAVNIAESLKGLS